MNEQRFITITRDVNGETETREVTALQWENMQAGSTYGFKEVVKVPAELAQLNKQNTAPTKEQQIAELEAAKEKAETPQQKANITKQINALKNAQA